ncbi:ankyrin repeat-containing domain protein, partial [Baffinella frigidus]
STGLNPLHVAVKNRHPDVVLVLLQCGADVQYRCNGKTPLLRAAWGGRYIHDAPRGQLAIAHLLLQHGADVSAFGVRGDTPLHYAVTDGNHSMVVLLLKNGADINGRNRHGSTPLHIGVLETKASICQLLIENGADKHATNDEGISPMYMA